MGGLFAVGLVASWMVAGWLVAPAPCVVGDPPADLAANSISFVSESGATLSGWHVRVDGSRGVVVLVHGIRSSRLSMLERARWLRAAGFSVVMFDLQGHGESPAERITVGYLEKHDVRAAVEFARAEHPGEPIGVVGASLGGAAALLASPLSIDALVLESVYPSIRDAVHNRVAAQLGPLSTLPAELLLAQLKPRLGISPSELRPIDHVAEVGCPVFLLCGKEDRHTTVEETRAMFATAREPKELWLVEGAAHVDLCHASPAEYRKRVLQFLGQHMQVRRPE